MIIIQFSLHLRSHGGFAAPKDEPTLSRDGRARTPVALDDYAVTWIAERRRRGLANVDDDERQLRLHASPAIGAMHLAAVRPRHVLALVTDLLAQGKLSPRSIRKVYAVLHVLFADAVFDELLGASPCVLRADQLPPAVDKDPEWRASAVFTRRELEALVGSPGISRDRRVLYALQGLAGLRLGEALGLRWRDYLDDLEPLGKLVVARQATRSRTKTRVTREIPVHPALAAILARWRAAGFARMLGRAPEPDDLVVPSRRGATRTRGHAYNKLLDDLRRLGWRRRRSHDPRRTFVTLARSDGARPDILQAITHTAPRTMLNVYSSIPWATLCEEVRRLRITTRAPGAASSAGGARGDANARRSRAETGGTGRRRR